MEKKEIMKELKAIEYDLKKLLERLDKDLKLIKQEDVFGEE